LARGAQEERQVSARLKHRTAKAKRGLAPVTDAHRAQMGLLPAYKFFHEHGGQWDCWLCKRPASYVTKNAHGYSGWCFKHARDF